MTRLQALRCMLKELKRQLKRVESSQRDGLCDILNNVTYSYDVYYSLGDLGILRPEKCKRNGHDFWWPQRCTKTRIRVVERAIKRNKAVAALKQ